jgi:hypothetical protein
MTSRFASNTSATLLKPETFADWKLPGKPIGLVLRPQLVRKAVVVQRIVPREVDALFHALQFPSDGRWPLQRSA